MKVTGNREITVPRCYTVTRMLFRDIRRINAFPGTGEGMDELRLAVIGIGNMGSAHARHIAEGAVREAKLTAVCDIAQTRRDWAAQALGGGVKIYSDYHQLLDEHAADAVVIAVPHPLHPVIGIEALEKGYHVLTEKPEGIDKDSAQKLNECAAKSDRTFAIMFNQRTNPLFQKMRGLVKGGELGNVRHFIWIVNNWYRTQAYYDSGSWRATWNGEGGGVLMNQCPHNLDIWQWIMGMPDRIVAECGVSKYHHINVEDEATILATYKNGATAAFVTSTGEQPGTNRMEISGSKGKAVIEGGRLMFWKNPADTDEATYTAAESFPKTKPEFQEWVQTEPEPAHIGILNNFARAVLHGEPLLSPGEDGVNELEIANAAYLSSWTGRWVDLPLDGAEYLKQLRRKQEEERAGGQSRKVKAEKADGEYSDRWMVRW